MWDYCINHTVIRYFRNTIYRVMVLLDVLSGPQDGPAQGCGLIRSSMQVIKDHLLQIRLHFLHLSEDHPSLPLDLCLTQRAVLDDVSQDLHSLGRSNKMLLACIKSYFLSFYKPVSTLS